MSSIFFHKELIFNPQKKESNNWIVALSVVFLGYLIRLFYSLYFSTLSRDSYTYINIIIQSTNMPDLSNQELMYSLFIYIYRFIYNLFNLNPYIILRAFTISLGSATVYILLLIAKELSSQKTVWIIGGLFAATNPRLVHYSSQIQRECIYLFFSSCILLFLIKWIKYHNKLHLISLGVFSSCNCLIRLEALEFIPLISFVILLSKNNCSRFYSIKNFILFLLVLSLSIFIILINYDKSFFYLKYIYYRIRIIL